MKSFGFGEVFSRFFKLLGENFGLFAMIGLVGTILPAIAVNYGLFTYLGVSPGDWSERFKIMNMTNWYYIVGAGLVLAALNLMNLSIVTEVAILRAVNKPVKLGAVLGHSLVNILPILGVSICVTLIVMGGMILLIVPGIIWALATCVAVPAYVGQPGLGVSGAVTRAFELTRNHRWTLFAIFLVGMIVMGLVGSGFGVGLVAAHDVLPAEGLYANILSSAFSAVTDLIGNVFVVAVYVCLRESKDKMAPDQTAAVFS